VNKKAYVIGGIILAAIVLFAIVYGTIWFVFFQTTLAPADAVWVKSINVANGDLDMDVGIMDSALVIKKIDTKVDGTTVYVSVYRSLNARKSESGEASIQRHFNNIDIEKVVLTGSGDKDILLWTKTFNRTVDFADITGISISHNGGLNGAPSDDDRKIDADQASRFIQSVAYKTDPVIGMGYIVGWINKGGEKIKFNISDYGDYFTIDGIDGYFEIDKDLADEWEHAIGVATGTP